VLVNIKNNNTNRILGKQKAIYKLINHEDLEPQKSNLKY